MRLLLDTHVFLWWHSDPAHLSPRALALCSDPSNSLLLSAASVWEMQIKLQLGKLSITAPLTDIIAQQQTNGLTILPILLPHVFGLDRLPTHHKDPFDRMLIAQAIVEGIALISADSTVALYPITILW